jgi:hypothetical protein
MSVNHLPSAPACVSSLRRYCRLVHRFRPRFLATFGRQLQGTHHFRLSSPVTPLRCSPHNYRCTLSLLGFRQPASPPSCTLFHRRPSLSVTVFCSTEVKVTLFLVVLTDVSPYVYRWLFARYGSIVCRESVAAVPCSRSCCVPHCALLAPIRWYYIAYYVCYAPLY